MKAQASQSFLVYIRRLIYFGGLVKFLAGVIVLSLSLSAFATSDGELIKALKAGSESGDIEVMNIENPIDPLPVNLPGDLAKSYDPENEFAKVGFIPLLGTRVYIYQNLLDGGNGCYEFFNLQGKFLDSICGSESSEWSWSSDAN
jgi:hypothetical protein